MILLLNKKWASKFVLQVEVETRCLRFHKWLWKSHIRVKHRPPNDIFFYWAKKRVQDNFSLDRDKEREREKKSSNVDMKRAFKFKVSRKLSRNRPVFMESSGLFAVTEKRKKEIGSNTSRGKGATGPPSYWFSWPNVMLILSLAISLLKRALLIAQLLCLPIEPVG